jgi:hypothetical protein
VNQIEETLNTGQKGDRKETRDVMQRWVALISHETFTHISLSSHSQPKVPPSPPAAPASARATQANSKTRGNLPRKKIIWT